MAERRKNFIQKLRGMSTAELRKNRRSLVLLRWIFIAIAAVFLIGAVVFRTDALSLSSGLALGVVFTTDVVLIQVKIWFIDMVRDERPAAPDREKSAS